MDDDRSEKTSEGPASKEMLDFFLQELAGQIDNFESALSARRLKEVKKSLHVIQSSAKIVRFDFVVSLGKKILSSLEKIHTLSTQDIEILKRAVNLLKELASTSPGELMNKAGELEEQAHELEEFLNRLTGVEAAETKEEASPEEAQEYDPSLLDLFCVEAESQASILNQGLLVLESDKASGETFHNLMRAAHSLKGAARVVGLDPLVELSHAMEDCFVALENDPSFLNADLMDALFQAVDYFSSLISLPKNLIGHDIQKQEPTLRSLTSVLRSLGKDKIGSYAAEGEKKGSLKTDEPQKSGVWNERVLRVSSVSLNRLMGLAGESLVESLWLEPFGEALLNLKHLHNEMARDLDQIRESLKSEDVNEKVFSFLSSMQQQANICRQSLDKRLSELEMFVRRHSSLSERLYGEVIDIRMRPLADGVKGFPRYVRDVGKELGKKVRLEIIGEMTPVDRDILEKLETPLMHLLRNAVDHGIEKPDVRKQEGKPEEGIVKLEATHRAGMLYITITDDGRGVDIEKIREKVVKEKIVNEDVVQHLSEQELLDFLFLPNFTTAEDLTVISGRGMGLNIVQNMVQEVGGIIRTSTTKGRHLTFHLQLPLTLSIIRSLLVEVAGEPYAFPLARIDRSLHINKSDIEMIENRQYFNFDGDNVGLVHASQIFEIESSAKYSENIPVIILNDRINRYGVVVDRFIAEKDLVVQEVDPALGKIPGINSGAFMEDGAPLLIIDVEDMLRALDKVLYGEKLRRVKSEAEPSISAKPKRILIVDDSITVREVECRLLQNKGYEVQTAVDGADGWNAVRIGNFDLVITDIDMPRMSGIDLVKSIKSDPRLNKIPVMIVSYKDRDADRRKGIEAGADYYLTKSSFHDETLAQAVAELIGGK